MQDALQGEDVQWKVAKPRNETGTHVGNRIGNQGVIGFQFFGTESRFGEPLFPVEIVSRVKASVRL